MAVETPPGEVPASTDAAKADAAKADAAKADAGSTELADAPTFEEFLRQGPEPSSEPPAYPGRATNEQAARFQRCSEDRDCTIVVNGCCGPGGGREAIGVRKDMAKAFHTSLKCPPTTCSRQAMVGGGDERARCVEQRCTYNGLI